jgi:hypothetical protein
MANHVHLLIREWKELGFEHQTDYGKIRSIGQKISTKRSLSRLRQMFIVDPNDKQEI